MKRKNKSWLWRRKKMLICSKRSLLTLIRGHGVTLIPFSPFPYLKRDLKHLKKTSWQLLVLFWCQFQGNKRSHHALFSFYLFFWRKEFSHFLLSFYFFFFFFLFLRDCFSFSLSFLKMTKEENGKLSSCDSHRNEFPFFEKERGREEENGWKEKIRFFSLVVICFREKKDEKGSIMSLIAKRKRGQHFEASRNGGRERERELSRIKRRLNQRRERNVVTLWRETRKRTSFRTRDVNLNL